MTTTQSTQTEQYNAAKNAERAERGYYGKNPRPLTSSADKFTRGARGEW